MLIWLFWLERSSASLASCTSTAGLIGYLLRVGAQALDGLDAQSTHAQNDRDRRQENDHEAHADVSITHFEYLQEVTK
jgi:hypothetical protein